MTHPWPVPPELAPRSRRSDVGGGAQRGRASRVQADGTVSNQRREGSDEVAKSTSSWYFLNRMTYPAHMAPARMNSGSPIRAPLSNGSGSKRHSMGSSTTIAAPRILRRRAGRQEMRRQQHAHQAG